MQSEPTSRRRPALPLGLLGMIALVAMTEQGVRRAGADLAEVASHNWRIVGRDSQRLDRKGGVLCLGSSLMKFGAVTSVIARETGRPADNLALFSGNMLTSYFVLRRALESGARPAAVLLDCQDGPIARGDSDSRNPLIRANTRHWPEFLTARDAAELAWDAGDPAVITETAVAWLLPSMKQRRELRGRVASALQGVPEANGPLLRAVRRNWRVNGGTHLMPGRTEAADSLPVAPGTVAAADPGRWRRNRLSETYTRKFLDLAAAHDLPVVWVFPPLPPSGQRQRDVEGITHTFNEQARRILSAYPNVSVVDARDGGYGPTVFHDTVHLDGRGAVAFSHDLGVAVARLLAGTPADRWVRLPRFEARPAPAGSEDLRASLLAVKAGSGRVTR